MAVFGLFTREATRGGKTAPAKDAGLSDERLHTLGERGVQDMNPEARTPHMKPRGSKHPEVYILGEAPDKEDDRDGYPFAGRNGDLLWRLIPEDVKVRTNNCVRTWPVFRKTFEPTHHEIECYRPSVEQDIAKTKPKIILALGDTATQWCLGPNAGQISVCRGRRFPVTIGGHTCWVYPAHHPAYIRRVLDSDDYAQIPGTEHEKYFEKDIRRVFKELPNLPLPQVEDQDHLTEGVTLLYGKDPERELDHLKLFLKRMRHERVVAIDVESNRLRPHAAGSKLLSIAIGTRKEVYAVGLDHPQCKWNPRQKERVQELIRDFLLHKVAKVYHNAPFDLEWLGWSFGEGILWSSKIHDAMGQAYIIDERKGGMSLNFLNILHFGLQLKKQSTGRGVSGWFGMMVQEESEIDRAKLEQTYIEDVLLYNGLDSKYTHKLERRQRAILEDRGLWEAYSRWVDRVPALATAQLRGIPVDEKTNQEFSEKLTAQVKQALATIKETKAVKMYEKKYGEFNPASPQQAVRMFRDHLKRPEGKRGKKYSTDDGALSLMKDEPLAAAVLNLRSIQKLKGTYVDRMNRHHAKPLVYPDNRIHCAFRHTKTDTKRLSSDDPNNQNWPKRKEIWIRRQIAPRSGHVIISADQGQIEARVIGMASKDKTLCDALWTDYDIHMVWAEKIVRVFPDTARTRYGSLDEKAMKKFRGDVKNQMVFPSFFGSRPESVARDLEMPERKLIPLFDEFWDMFAGVLQMQEDWVRFYNKYGYVQALTGHRRHGPMNKNQLINAPIQGTASDITVHAMRVMAKRAYETDRPWLAPNLNIHDDLTMTDVPVKKQDECIEELVTAMCSAAWTPGFKEFINVPLLVEVSVGPNWAEMKEVGKFRSDSMKEGLRAYRKGLAHAA